MSRSASIRTHVRCWDARPAITFAGLASFRGDSAGLPGGRPWGRHGARARVFNGNAVAVPSYMAFLRAANGDGTWSCGATAISRNVVLTAAHCVVDEVTNEY